MSKVSYNFYMAKCDADGVVLKDETLQPIVKNLMKDFNGLVYSQCKGLRDIGASKNIYTEEYSDSESIRVFIPEVITNKPTTIVLTLFFTGKDRYAVRDEFNKFIRNGYTLYWDDARKYKFQFYVSKELPIGEEKWYGSLPYLKCEYKLENMKGYTEKVETKPF